MVRGMHGIAVIHSWPCHEYFTPWPYLEYSPSPYQKLVHVQSYMKPSLEIMAYLDMYWPKAATM